MGYLRVRNDEVRIAKVVGENEDGLTLFVKQDGHGDVMVWIPWEG